VATSSRPRFVNRWGVGASPQPFRCENVTSYQFVLEGKLDNLQRLCARYFEQPTNGECCYVPITRLVWLTVSFLDSIGSVDEWYGRFGKASETEIALLVLTARIKKNGNVPVLDHLAWFCPYIFTDNAAAISGGREIYGFPKELAWVDCRVHGPVLDNCTVDAQAVNILGPSARIARLQLLSVLQGESTLDLPGRLLAVWDRFEDAVEDIRQRALSDQKVLLPGLGLLTSVNESLWNRELPIVFLKQLPDHASGDLASYQAVVEAGQRMTVFRRGNMSRNTYTVELIPRESHPIQQDLGLGDTNPVQFAYFLDYGLILESGTTVWEAK
jgi:hypothetical protein